MIYFNYGLLFNIWTCDQKNRFLCRHIIGRCLQLCCCVTHESLQALRYSLQAADSNTSLVDVCSCVVVSHMMNHCRLNDILCRLFQVLCRLKHIIGLCLQLFSSDRCRQTCIIEGSSIFSAGCTRFSADLNTSLVYVCSCVALIDADKHGSLQALRHSLQAVTCSLQAHRANLYVD